MEKIGIILAAGEGKRMKSEKSKLLHKVMGMTMIERVYGVAKEVGMQEIVVVVGHKKEQIQAVLQNKVKYAVQEEQKGTGHAVMMAEEYLKERQGKTYILYGDAPIVTPETLKALGEYMEERGEQATILSAIYENPTGYGRIVRGVNGEVERIVEQKDATEEERKIQEINSGLYCFDTKALYEALKEIQPNNQQGEYYLTDVIEIMKKKGLKVGAFITKDNSEILGANDKAQIAILNEVIQKRNNLFHMKNGVTIVDPKTTYIEDHVQIGADTVIYPNTYIHKNVMIGKDCEIGPFAHIRENVKMENQVVIGSFVEVHETQIGEGSVAKHHAYLGNSKIGEQVNIACGVITCNYNGKEKQETIIEDKVFVGSNVNLIAPVKLEKGAYIAAGSTITEDVQEGQLAIARKRQQNKERKI